MIIYFLVWNIFIGICLNIIFIILFIIDIHYEFKMKFTEYYKDFLLSKCITILIISAITLISSFSLLGIDKIDKYEYVNTIENVQIYDISEEHLITDKGNFNNVGIDWNSDMNYDNKVNLKIYQVKKKCYKVLFTGKDYKIVIE
ncbi:MAG: hypothetical protein WDK95_06725 [Syntrophorhabdaceae bacterium]